MTRVASLYLPHWPIERLWRVERTNAPLEWTVLAADTRIALKGAVAAERANECSVPRDGHWRPGARWSRADVQSEIDALPAHQRPPLRELGRRSEAADNPFRPCPGDEGTNGSRDNRTSGASNPKADFNTAKSVRAERGKDTTRTPRDEPILPAPLVTSIRTGSSITVAAASPAARALGIVPGMAVTQARALVPGLDIRQADPHGDRADLDRLALAAARRWTPVVMVSGEDGLFLDIAGASHLLGGEAAMAGRIVRLLARLGYTARIAIADTAGAAHALARHGRQAVTLCPPGQQAQAISALPASALRIEDRATELLRRLGVELIGDLIAMPRAPLARRFGARLVTRLDQALGRAPEPLDPVVPAEHIAVVQRFAEPIATAEAILHWLGRLVPQLVIALAKAGLGARALDFVADRVDGDRQRIRVGLARPSRDAAHLIRLLARRIEEIDPGFGIDALALHVRRADRLGPQALGTRLDEESARDITPLIDSLANRIGGARLWRTGPLESDVPERSVRALPPIEQTAATPPRLKHEAVQHLTQASMTPAWHPHWPRPVRLLAHPEQVDHVVAELPDHPPRRFTWRGQSHRIVRADGPERIHGEWWKRRSEIQAVRDYFRVEDESGQRFWLFRKGDGIDRATGPMRWYIHGAFG